MTRWSVLLTVAAMAVSTSAAAQSPVGDWAGVLEVGQVKLHIGVHVHEGSEGELTGTLDSPDQGVTGLLLADISRQDDALSFTVPAINGRYAAKWDAASRSWKGQWSQGGPSASLDLTVGAPPAPPKPLPADWRPPADAAIHQLIAERIAPREGEGIAVGVLDGRDRRIVTGGAVTPDTLFEIGSITKVFTATILADMAAKGEVSLDDPAEKYLPAGAHMPERNGRKITLRDLSMHRSGLPRVPDNMPMADPEDPYSDYTEAQLLDFLSHYPLTRDIGSQWEYSNLGVGLLGYLLGRAAHKDYPTLLRERITGPLGMHDTVLTLSTEQRKRFATPYDAYGRPTKPWKIPALAGAGGIRSTAGDMLKFAAAVIDPRSPLAPAVKLELSELGPAIRTNVHQGLGWQIVDFGSGRRVLTHDGGTGGFRSTLALEPARQRAVVVLANSGAEPSTTDMALHILIGSPVAPTPALPNTPPPRTAHTEMTLPAAELDRVIGRYDFGNGVIFEVTRAPDGLRAQRQGSVTGPSLPIFAEAPLKFFWRAVDAAVTFTADESGKVTGATFTQAGATLTGKRVD